MASSQMQTAPQRAVVGDPRPGIPVPLGRFGDRVRDRVVRASVQGSRWDRPSVPFEARRRMRRARPGPASVHARRIRRWRRAPRQRRPRRRQWAPRRDRGGTGCADLWTRAGCCPAAAHRGVGRSTAGRSTLGPGRRCRPRVGRRWRWRAVGEDRRVGSHQRGTATSISTPVSIRPVVSRSRVNHVGLR